MRSFYELRPEHIMESREKCGIAFVPVGPLEWHSYHLPFGTDAMIAEGIAKLVAEKIGGIYFPPLLLGTDQTRTAEQLDAWGFDKSEDIFGMNFPQLPLKSEYCSPEELAIAVTRRLKFIRDNKFKAAFVIDHHGGNPDYPELEQKEIIKNVCKKFNSPDFKVEFTDAFRFCTLKGTHIVPDHATLSETTFLLAFRPELIFLNRIPEGELIPAKMGMVTGRAVITVNENPRNALKVLADEFRENVINNFVNYIKENYL
ncbi:MAG: creatininase family protein [Actinobacteria bacterium]|nr:creatininase family protein [Actinomycetota bacterium]